MLKIQKIKFSKFENNSNLLKFSRKYFQILTPQEYLVNMKESMRRMSVESCTLKPMPEASKKNNI